MDMVYYEYLDLIDSIGCSHVWGEGAQGEGGPIWSFATKENAHFDNDLDSGENGYKYNLNLLTILHSLRVSQSTWNGCKIYN